MKCQKMNSYQIAQNDDARRLKEVLDTASRSSNPAEQESLLALSREISERMSFRIKWAARNGIRIG